jgi:hypothetical protein
MWPFSLFKKKSAELHPESLWTLEVDGDLFRGKDHTGAEMEVAASELAKVAIETNDSGPWGADVYWLLFGRDGSLQLAFPQGATGEKAVIDELMKLPGFDNEQVIRAMGSTNNAVFVVWENTQPPQT